MLAIAALKGAGWLVFSRFVGRIIDFFNLLVLARLLAPADFGLAALAMALVVVIDTVLEIPVTQALVRLDAIDKRHLDTGFTLGVIRSAVIAMVFLAFAWPYAWFNGDPLLIPLISVLALGPIARGVISPALVYFQRNLNFRPIFIIETGSKICAFAAAILTVLAGQTYWAIVANFVVTSLSATIASYIIAPYRPELSLKRLGDFASFIGWFSSAQLIAALNWQYDRFLIGAAGDKTMLGRYAVANDVAVVPTQSIIGPALQPVMAAFSQISADRERMKTAFLKATRFAMVVSVPTCIGICLTADLITDILLGPQWKDAAPYLSLLALSVIPIPYFQTLYSASLALDRPKIIFRLNAIDLILRVVLISSGFFLFAAAGAASARILLSFLMFALYLIEAKSLLALGYWTQLKNIVKIVCAALMMTFLVQLLRVEVSTFGWYDIVELMFVGCFGATIYLSALFALGLRLKTGDGRLELADRG